MERDSPIKAWMHRHSPIKGRNKPLPPPPNQTASPPKRPISQISGNAGITSAEQQHKSKRRLASLFRSTEKTASPSEALPSKSQQQTNSASANGLNHSVVSPNLRNLSAKVHSLETQLRDARKQLDEYASTSQRARNDSHRRESGRQNTKYRQGSSENKVRYSNSKNDSGNSSANATLDGVVESLLQEQHRRGSTGRHKTTSRPASADMSEAFDHYRRALSAYEEARDECASLCVSDGEHDSEPPDNLKRKRSQVRSSSWQAVQQYAAREARLRQSGQRSESREAEKASVIRCVASDGPVTNQEYQDYHDKSLPKSPTKSVSPTPRKKNDVLRTSCHRRSGSKTRNDFENQEQGSDKQDQKTSDTAAPPLSPSKRYASSPSKLLPVAEEFEWDDEVF